MATRAELEAMISREATAAGMSPSDFIRMAEIESSFNPNAGSKKSSAKGLFQFTNGTAKTYGLKNVYDPLESTRAAIRLAKDNIKATGARDGADIYMAHQWGSGGFNKMKNADPNASVESVLGVDAARNNAMGGMTVAQGKAFWRNKFNGGKGGGNSTNYQVQAQEMPQYDDGQAQAQAQAQQQEQMQQQAFAQQQEVDRQIQLQQQEQQQAQAQSEQLAELNRQQQENLNVQDAPDYSAQLAKAFGVMPQTPQIPDDISAMIQDLYENA